MTVAPLLLRMHSCLCNDPHTLVYLHSHLHYTSPQIVTDGERECLVALQVAGALDFLHQHPLQVCHRDVKLDNVLIAGFSDHADGLPRPTVKVADFGFSKASEARTADSCITAAVIGARTKLGTALYVAPEIYKLDSYATLITLGATSSYV